MSSSSNYHPIIKDAFQDAFNLHPFEWQIKVIEHLLRMWNNNCPLVRSTVFLSQPTGGGKSLCRDAYSAIVGGITWSFSPLPPLQTDQVSKLNNYDNAPCASKINIYIRRIICCIVVVIYVFVHYKRIRWSSQH